MSAKTLDSADEIELLTAWVTLMRKRGDLQLDRPGRTETRHVCHYMAGALNDLRNSMLRPDMNSANAIIELRRVIVTLEGLITYLETGRGGFSALGDRNAR